jgi:hypothetical protein
MTTASTSRFPRAPHAEERRERDERERGDVGEERTRLERAGLCCYQERERLSTPKH